MSASLLGSWGTGTTHTAEAGSDRVLAVVVSHRDAATTRTATAVTYGGVALTRAVKAAIDTGAAIGAALWYLDEAGIAAAASSTIAVTWDSAPTTEHLSHAFFGGVDQENPVRSRQGNGPSAATTVTLAPMLTAVGDMTVTGVVANNTNALTFNNSFTEGIDASSGSGRFGAGHKAAAGTSDTPSVTSTGSAARVLVGIVLRSSATAATTVSGTGVRLDVFNADGTARAEGPITDVIEVSYGSELMNIGRWQATVPATLERASILAQGRIVSITLAGEGRVFRGIIDQAATDVDENNVATKRVSGRSLAAEMVKRSAYNIALSSATLPDSFDDVVASTSWAFGDVDETVLTALQRFDGVSRWAMGAALTDTFNMHIRERLPDRGLDVGAFGTNPNGLRLRAFETVPDLSDNPYLAAITGARVLVESSDLCNRVIPIGQKQGLNGENLTLRNATRTSPYTVQNLAGSDGKTVYYLEDAASVAAYGLSERVVQFKDILPFSVGTTADQAASNALYDNAVTWLGRQKDPQTAYAFRVAGLKHFSGGVPVVQVGNTVRAIYRGVAVGADGTRRTWIDVDASLYLMGFTRSIRADGADEWSITLSTVPRSLPTDGSVAAEMYEQLTAVQAAPFPYTLFADSNGSSIMRLDPYGLRMVVASSDGASHPGIFWGRDALMTTESPYAGLDKVWLRSYFTGSTIGFTAILASAAAHQASLQLWADSGSGYAHLGVNRSPDAYFPGFRVSAGSAGALATPYQSKLGLGTSETLTIASGAVSGAFRSYITVDTEGGAASDDLDTISLMATGAFMFLQPNNAARTVVVKHGTGNIVLVGERDMELDDTDTWLLLMGSYTGDWVEIARSTPMSTETVLVKSADASITSDATLNNDSELVFAAKANKAYLVELLIHVTSASTPDFKFTIVGPSGATGGIIYQLANATGDFTQVALATSISVPISGTEKTIRVWAAVQLSSTAGNITFQWSQDTSSGTATIVRAGSHMIVREGT